MILYKAPKKLSELEKFTAGNQIPLRWLGGTTQLDPSRNQLGVPHRDEKKYKANFLWISLSKIPELNSIQPHSQGLWFGSSNTCEDLINSELLPKCANAIKLAIENYSTLQIRNHTSIGTLLAAKDNYTDLYPPFMVLDTRIILLIKREYFSISFSEFLQKKETILRESGVILGLFIPYEGQKSTFVKTQGPHPLSPSKLSLAIALSVDGDKFRNVRLAFSTTNSQAARAIGVEGLMEGQPIDYLPLIKRSILQLRSLALPNTDHISNSRYRKWQLGNLFIAALKELLPPEVSKIYLPEQIMKKN